MTAAGEARAYVAHSATVTLTSSHGHLGIIMSFFFFLGASSPWSRFVKRVSCLSTQVGDHVSQLYYSARMQGHEGSDSNYEGSDSNLSCVQVTDSAASESSCGASESWLSFAAAAARGVCGSKALLSR
jgi:hypothetical protein